MAILEIENVSFTYPMQTKPALKNVSFSLEKGDFALICGATGSGKSTLLKLIKRELRPEGELNGKLRFLGKDLDEANAKESAYRIGFVMQKPEQQIVTDKVWHELAFGLENMGLPSDEIRARVAEMACFFGIEEWFSRKVSELSGGQKQLLNLASVMVMQPDVLLLDEPTAQLDPIAASEFISTVAKLNRELALTVLMIEHRLEEAMPLSNKVIALKGGAVYSFGNTLDTVRKMRSDGEFLPYLPSAVRLSAGFSDDICPITVNEGRRFVQDNFDNRIRKIESDEIKREGNVALEFKNVFFRYAHKLPDVLAGLSFKLYEGEILCVLGGNGSGKSTMLSCAAGLNKPYSGQISVFGKKIGDYKNQTLYKGCLSLLPQDVQTVFLHNTVREELEGIDTSEQPFDLSHLYSLHPYDLSGGQQQLLALSLVLGSKPKLLLMDEPTKGLDANTKTEFISVMKKLRGSGVTILCVTHDVEFAAAVADRLAMFFLGEIVSTGETRSFFAQNSFYTTAVSRMTRGIYDNAVTLEDAQKLMCLNGKKT